MTTLRELEAFLTDRLARPLPGVDAQRRFAPRPARPGWEPDAAPTTAREAAALLLIYPHNHQLFIPLTLRHAGLPHHPGQVSLPGGRIDAGETPDQAALREAHEEIAIDRDRVRLTGALSPVWIIVSNHVLRPFIGVTETRPNFLPAAREVDAIIEVPLDDLRDHARLKWTRRTAEASAKAEPVHIPYFDIAGHEVWGATAMILGEFVSLFSDAFGPGEIRE